MKRASLHLRHLLLAAALAPLCLAPAHGADGLAFGVGACAPESWLPCWLKVESLLCGFIGGLLGAFNTWWLTRRMQARMILATQARRDPYTRGL